MPLDGIAVSSIKHELKTKILGGRIDKIGQPEPDELILSIRNNGQNHRLFLSANPSNPRVHFVTKNKENPIIAPLFCMVLRKHLQNGKITSIIQPKFERIIEFYIESVNEMGDLSTKKLVVEIMGKHSNIILVSQDGMVLDAIKHVSYDKSSLRQVLPGRDFEPAPSQNKISPLELNQENFEISIKAKEQKISESIYKSYTGISPVMASEICTRAGLNPSLHTSEIVYENHKQLYDMFVSVVNDIKEKQFAPEIIYDKSGKPVEFSAFSLDMYKTFDKKMIDSISEVLENFYKEKDQVYRTSQKTTDLRKLIQNNIERLVKKKGILLKTQRDIENRELYKVYGELITANIYSVKKGMTMLRTINFYDENHAEIEIELDSTLTPSENAQKYFKRYNKEKRTHIALIEQFSQLEEDLFYLDSVLNTLNSPLLESDIKEIREELYEAGFIKKRTQAKKGEKPKKSALLTYTSKDGFLVYVGKNNKQNDEITFKIAESWDIWLHAKNIPGSHVLIKTEGREVLDSTIEEAAKLAAYYSKSKDESLVAIDYTAKKNVKKHPSKKLGMVTYENYKTANVEPRSGVEHE
ncbi:MAG: NFACT family protein [Defluviitaleaceae bacterium]|nr:NFACT family protein [Defluviitaleaceae bacterium]